MTRKDLIEAVAIKSSVPKCKTEAVLASLMETIEQAARHDESVHIPNFGIFRPQRRKPRRVVHIKTGQVLMSGEFYTVIFRASRSLRFPRPRKTCP